MYVGESYTIEGITVHTAQGIYTIPEEEEEGSKGTNNLISPSPFV